MTPPFLRWLLIASLSIAAAAEPHPRELRVVHKLVGGHLSLHRDDDIELMTSGAGEGRDKKKPPAKEEKKTLAQQVADGKYGLIQNELFSKPVKRPGIISYRDNQEVPNDNISNLGGLNKSDIWLSDNHLLVIKGGGYPDHDQNRDQAWPAIDDYNAPDRQVKIPKNPKVPPPFPVQLEEGGPLLLLGTNASKTLNGTFEEGVYPLYPEENYVTGDNQGQNGGEPGDRHPAYPPSGETPFPIPPFPPPGLDFYDPAKEGAKLNGSPPFFPPYFPMGELPNLDNFTYDEDDPSIYYPPPYSFFYPKDNTSAVPPGPLVPGIVLPPPPNFFAPLDEGKPTGARRPSTTQKPITQKPITQKPITQKPTTKKPTTTTQKPTTPQPIVITTSRPSKDRTKYYFYPIRNATKPTSVPHTRKPATTQVTRKKYPTVTILRPVTTTKQPDYIPFKVYGPPSEKPRVVVTSTRVPLKSYYTTTHLEPILVTERPQFVEIEKAPIVNIRKPERPRPNIAYTPKENVIQRTTTTQAPPVQYYYYDENSVTTARPAVKELPPKRYYLPNEVLIPKQKQQNNVRYYYVGDPEYEEKKPDTFSLHIAKLKQEIENFKNLQQNLQRNNYDNLRNDYENYQQRPVYQPKPVYQYEFQAAGYQDQQRYVEPKRRPVYSVEIQQAVEVTAPTPIYETTQEGNYYTDQVTENPAKIREPRPNRHRTPKPISQYSFEATENPIYQQYFTKQDEKYFDDVTKEYFTVFGKRLPAGTTPLPIQNYYSNTRPPPPISLERDTYVNYLPQRPQINPNAEYIQDVPPREERPLITYKLPGDEGTHFYFLTPQLAQNRDQNSNFYFSRQSRESKPPVKTEYSS